MPAPEKVKTPCPFTGRECLRQECSFCLNGSDNVHYCCQLQHWLDHAEHRQTTFNKRINELWFEARQK